jgi:E3 ubiquitin-protein ligase TRIP12
MGGGGGGSRIKTILAMLREEDEGQHLTGLNELCEYLAVATEETMVSFPIDQTVSILITFLGHEHNPDVMLLAARALTNLADVFPPACSYIIRHGAVPAFCARLLNIEYIDLAEQSLQALEKLSHEHPGSLLRAGALVAVLSYVDFFQTGVQRVAVATAANICRGLSTEFVDAVSTAAPILIGLLSYSDAKIVDSACLALTRISDAFSRSPEHMEMLVGFGLISSIVEMVAVSDTGSITSQLSGSTFYGLVKLLATCAGGSHVVAENLLQAGVSSTLNKLLMTSPLLSASLASPGNALRSADQLQDLVSLASQLLPSIPDASAAVLESLPAPPPVEMPGRDGRGGGGGAGPSAAPRPPSNAVLQATALAEYLQQNPEAADRVAEDLLAVMLKVHASSGTVQTKKASRNMLAKLLYHTSAPTLSKLLHDLLISSLVARLLHSEDPAIAAEGMQMADILMEKLPEEYSRYFLKEGVVHAMEELAATAVEVAVAEAPAAAPVASKKEKEKEKEKPAAVPLTGAQRAAAGAPAAGGSHAPRLTRRRTRSMAPEEEQLQQPRVEEEQHNEGEEDDEDEEHEDEQHDEEEREALNRHRARMAYNQRAPTGPQLKNALAIHAKKFCGRYFTDAQGNSLGCRTQGVLVLEKICERLPAPEAVQELLTVLAATGEASISTFEFLTSGTLRKLREYLQGEDLKEAAVVHDGEDFEEARRWQLLQRLSQFSQIALPPGSGGSPPLTVLVETIQGALTASEKFEVHTTDVAALPSAYSMFGGSFFGGGGGRSMSRSAGDASGSLSAGLAALSNPFKIRLSRHPSAAPPTARTSNGPINPDVPIGLKDYTSNVVLIEPLASMNQVEEFLWPRVQYSPGEYARMVSGEAAGRDEAARAAAAAAARDQGRGGGGAAAAAGGGAGAGGASGSGPRATSRSRPIPQPAGQNNQAQGQGKRLTRAQARAAAEAEVAGQGSGGAPTAGGDTTMAEGNQPAAEPAAAAAPTAAEAARALEPTAEEQAAARAMWGGVPDGEIESDEDYDDEEMEDGYVEGEEEFDEDGKFYYLFIYFKILRRRVEINILLLLSYLQRMICLMLLQCMYTICTLVALKMAHKSSVKRAHNLLPLQPPLLPLSNLPLLHLLLSLLLLLQVVVLTLELLLLALLQQLLETTLILLSISMAAYSNPLLPSSKPSVLL